MASHIAWKGALPFAHFSAITTPCPGSTVKASWRGLSGIAQRLGPGEGCLDPLGLSLGGTGNRVVIVGRVQRDVFDLSGVEARHPAVPVQLGANHRHPAGDLPVFIQFHRGQPPVHVH